MAITVVFTSCKKDDDVRNSSITSSGTTIKTSVTGRITDSNGSVVAGVMLKLGNITTVSDNRGYFLFVNIDVPNSRMVLSASKTGYFNSITAKKTQPGAANYINIVMEELPLSVSVSGAAGGIVQISGGAKITFPVNAFVDLSGNAYTGQVMVYARHINPGASNFESIVPGGDLTGVTVTGQTESLYSFGMIEALLFDNTGINELQLAPGKTAELKFPIDAAQTSAALSTVPMWHLEELTGLWIEEGQATKSGNFFVGEVSHFSTWNCDYPGTRTDITGKVVDCQNNAMANIVVTINGFMNVTTDNTGMFTTWVPAGYLIQSQVLMQYNSFIPGDSPFQSITAVAGQLNVIPDLIVACTSTITGSVKKCNGNQSSEGFVYATWNGGYRYLYIGEDGTYSMNIPEYTTINVLAASNGLQGSHIVASGAWGTSQIVPDILLCNTIQIGQNSFTINTNGISSITYNVTNITSNTSFADTNFAGGYVNIYISINGITNPGNLDFNMVIQLVTTSETNGYYDLSFSSFQNLMYFSLDNMGYYAGYPTLLTDNRLYITDYGITGSLMSGTYNYDTNNGSVTNGTFSIIRN